MSCGGKGKRGSTKGKIGKSPKGGKRGSTSSDISNGGKRASTSSDSSKGGKRGSESSGKRSKGKRSSSGDDACDDTDSPTEAPSLDLPTSVETTEPTFVSATDSPALSPATEAPVPGFVTLAPTPLGSVTSALPTPNELTPETSFPSPQQETLEPVASAAPTSDTASPVFQFDTQPPTTGQSSQTLAPSESSPPPPPPPVDTPAPSQIEGVPTSSPDVGELTSSPAPIQQETMPPSPAQSNETGVPSPSPIQQETLFPTSENVEDGPTIAPGSGVAVSATPFNVEYTLAGGRDPSLQELRQAQQITIDYLDTVFMMQYDFSFTTNYDRLTGSAGDESFSPPRSGFDIDVIFTNDSEIFPTTGDIDNQIFVAFVQPLVQGLIDQLRELPSTNIFSTATDVTYAIATSQDRIAPSQSTESDSTTATYGAIVGGLCAALILVGLVHLRISRRRRTRAYKQLSDDVEEKFSPIDEEEPLSHQSSSITSSSGATGDGGNILFDRLSSVPVIRGQGNLMSFMDAEVASEESSRQSQRSRRERRKARRSKRKDTIPRERLAL